MRNKERVGEAARIRGDNRQCDLCLSGRGDSEPTRAIIARVHPFLNNSMTFDHGKRSLPRWSPLSTAKALLVSLAVLYSFGGSVIYPRHADVMHQRERERSRERQLRERALTESPLELRNWHDICILIRRIGLREVRGSRKQKERYTRRLSAAFLPAYCNVTATYTVNCAVSARIFLPPFPCRFCHKRHFEWSIAFRVNRCDLFLGDAVKNA